ncbi:hypothetical protein EPI10_001871 [Gossypium australe]|uniref:Uncharacterized protein n=1 Tax=Gossypium australe TaxID=47621 RepID=A0A5B6VC89_9ROSI|nr:hypothetical protein EPI10_001871 [Gossypium australe]
MSQFDELIISRTEENGLRSRESESYRVAVVKATEGSGPSRIVITLLNLFWYTLELYKTRYGMYRLPCDLAIYELRLCLNECGLTLMGGIVALQMAYNVTRSWHTGVPKDRE